MKISVPAEKKLVYEMVIPIRWGDMDAMGHMNNGSYFRYLETMRIDWMHAIGCRPTPGGEGPVILNAFCNFYHQLVYPGDVHMRMFVSDVREKTFETWGTFARADAPQLICAEGGATTVWVDFPQQKSAPMPTWMRTLLTA